MEPLSAASSLLCGRRRSTRPFEASFKQNKLNEKLENLKTDPGIAAAGQFMTSTTANQLYNKLAVVRLRQRYVTHKKKASGKASEQMNENHNFVHCPQTRTNNSNGIHQHKHLPGHTQGDPSSFKFFVHTSEEVQAHLCFTSRWH